MQRAAHYGRLASTEQQYNATMRHVFNVFSALVAALCLLLALTVGFYSSHLVHGVAYGINSDDGTVGLMAINDVVSFYFHAQMVFSISLVWIVAALLVPPVLWAVVMLRIGRKRKRTKAGFCPNCGYDLRATPERCPECGTQALNG